MNTVIARRVTATPIRTSSEVWDVIRRLLSPDSKSHAGAMLKRAGGVACSAIASEVLKQDAIVVYGTGPRIRVYCLYDDDALSGEDASEGELPKTPTEGDWRLSLPVLDEDFEWSARAVEACAPHISVRRAGEEVPDESESDSSPQENRAGLRINLDRFLKS
jgi:hypothetical protein